MNEGLIELVWASVLGQSAPPVSGSAGGGIDQGALPLTTQPGSPVGPQGSAAPSNGFGLFLPMMMALFAFMILSTIFSGRKEKKRRAELLGSLVKYDRVQTTGGLIGTIVEVKDDEVVLKVDESTNTKVHFSKSSVQTVLKRGPSDTSDSLEPAETVA